MTRIGNGLNVCVRGSYTDTGFGITGTSATTGSQLAQMVLGQSVCVGSTYSYAGSEYVTTPTSRIAIDPNVRVRGNQTYSGFDDVSGPIAVGDQVEVYEAESGLVGQGRVTEIDADRELVFLSVDWASLTDEASPEAEPSPAMGWQPAGEPSPKVGWQQAGDLSVTVGALVYVPHSPPPLCLGEDAWMALMSTPCLAYVNTSDFALSMLAPAAIWAADVSELRSTAPNLPFRQQYHPGLSNWMVAA